MAIILAMQYSGFEIVGITTMFGNAYVDQATTNALTVVELSGRTIPVYKGAAKPLADQDRAATGFCPWQGWIGQYRSGCSQESPLAKSAAQFLVDIAKTNPGQITIVAVGRLTNLAQAMRAGFESHRNAKEMILMGGALHVPGNVSPVAEANISGDPDAADIVVTAPWRVTMIALNTTTRVRLNDDILLRIRDNNTGMAPSFGRSAASTWTFTRTSITLRVDSICMTRRRSCTSSILACSNQKGAGESGPTGHRHRRDNHARIRLPAGAAAMARQTRRDNGNRCRCGALPRDLRICHDAKVERTGGVLFSQQPIEELGQLSEINGLDHVRVKARGRRAFAVRRLAVSGDRDQQRALSPTSPPTAAPARSHPSAAARDRAARGRERKLRPLERGGPVERHPRVMPDRLERLRRQPRRVDVVVDDENAAAGPFVGRARCPAESRRAFVDASPRQGSE